jgi:N-acetylneuraminate synthase
MKYLSKIFVNNREISINSPTYFIADIAANHDGDLQRAKDLIFLAKQSGADAVKFQHFLASKIVSDYGFKRLGGQLSHQAKWSKPVFDIYKQYECDRTWTEELVKTASGMGIDIFTAPYDNDAVDLWDKYSAAFKIGSGDITWIDFIKLIAKKCKPTFMATGASSMGDVERAVDAFCLYNQELILMQCNTNYTGSMDNFKYVNLNVLKTYAQKYPEMVLGLSDHTPGHATVLGAIALGARAVEKHFTDDNLRVGPDHGFALNPKSWKEMVDRSRELEASFGDGIKRVEKNEQDTVVVQRRSIRFKRDMLAGEVINDNDIEFLRPAPIDACFPYEMDFVVGKKLVLPKPKGDCIKKTDLD